MNVYNQDEDTYAVVADGVTVIVTAAITDTNSGIIDNTDITGNFDDLGFGTSVNATSYNQATAIASWTLAGVSISSNGTLVVTVSLRDDAGNRALDVSGSIIGDTAVPVINTVNVYNDSEDS